MVVKKFLHRFSICIVKCRQLVFINLKPSGPLELNAELKIWPRPGACEAPLTLLRPGPTPQMAFSIFIQEDC